DKTIFPLSKMSDFEDFDHVFDIVYADENNGSGFIAENSGNCSRNLDTMVKTEQVCSGKSCCYYYYKKMVYSKLDTM
ncbi:hypothetical protein L9F63_016216, partial [Diploptera punctata]